MLPSHMMSADIYVIKFAAIDIVGLGISKILGLKTPGMQYVATAH